MSGGRTAMTQSHSVHGGALSFMSCTSGRESSPLDENDSHQTSEFKTETKKKRFHPLRNLRRMFRRKTRHSNVSNDSYNIGTPESTEINGASTPLEQRSCSTSKLVEENGIQNLMKNNRLAPGLSLSHDSVFTPDRADSGLSSSDLENSSLSISNFVAPPVEYPLKSHSSCSESSLLSIDSSEAELSPTVIKSDLDLGVTSYKLSHSAAKHKMAVKPKRNHGAPRSKRRAMNSRSPLPSTPEVNEEAANGKVFLSNTTDAFEGTIEGNASPTSKPSSPIEELEKSISISDHNGKSTAKSYESDFVLSPKIVRSKLNIETVQDESVNYGNYTTSAGTFSIDKEIEDGTKSKMNGEEDGDINEDDWGEREEEASSRKEESSFFGRLLSRRSEKKKKHNPEPASVKCNEEHSSEDNSQLGKNVSSVKISQQESIRSSAAAAAAAGNRSISRRQRVEPIEIPSSPSLLKKNEFECSSRNIRENSNRMKISYSMSPPKTVVPNPIVSRSSSPPKVVWPEHFSYYKSTSPRDSLVRDNSRTSTERKPFDEFNPCVAESMARKDPGQEDVLTKIRRDLSPIASKTKETQKLLADEMESKFKMMHSSCEDRGGIVKNSDTNSCTSKEDSANAVIAHERENDTDDSKLRIMREDDSPKSHSRKLSSEVDKGHVMSRKEEEKASKAGKVNIQSGNSFDSIDKLEVNLNEGSITFKSVSSDSFPTTDVLITHEEPHYVNLKNIIPVLSSYEKVHHGYENVQVIELVKKEKDAKLNLSEEQKTKEEKSCRSQRDVLNGADGVGASYIESSIEKRIIPKIIQFDKLKPGTRKERIDGTPEFMKVQLNRVESRSDLKSSAEKIESCQEKPEPVTITAAAQKIKSTLIERRKSELMLTNETEEKDWKPKVKLLKKQTSFSENGSAKRSATEHGNQEKSFPSDGSPPKSQAVPNEKTDTTEEASEVVLRKKPNASGNDDQPELMKVFARRSLKVRESEEFAEEMRRSRDSDKENENQESPKEERKKIVRADPDEKKQENEMCSKSKSLDESQTPTSKPEIGIRKCVFQKYGRSASENGKATAKQDSLPNGVTSAENKGKTRKDQSILEENKLNKLKEAKIGNDLVTVSCIKEAISVTEDDVEETGFKRIQQRKAEWERRVQQAAK